MCRVNPFPFTTQCAHHHDNLDRAIVVLLVGSKKRLSRDDILARLKEQGQWCYMALLLRRLKLLKEFGWTDSATKTSFGAVESYGWLWGATSKATETHYLWLLDGICPGIAA